MTWYKEMTEQQKRALKKVITISVIGAIIMGIFFTCTMVIDSVIAYRGIFEYEQIIYYWEWFR